MRTTVECEAMVLDLEALAVDPLGNDASGAVDPAPGAGYLLAQLPPGRWAVIAAGSASVARHRLDAAGLPVPSVLIATETAPDAADLRRAAHEMGADPTFVTVVAGSLATLEACEGFEVVAVASAAEPDRLRAISHVVPSLSSVRVLGQHPVLVLEVDTIPDR